MRLSFPFGHEEQFLDVPDSSLRGVLRSGINGYEPEGDPDFLVRKALENPIVYETEHVIGTSVILVSEKVWQQFTAEEQKIVSEAMKEACDWFQVETEKQISENKAFLTEKGVVFTPCTDKQAWIDACAPLYAKYAAGVQDFFSIRPCWNRFRINSGWLLVW